MAPDHPGRPALPHGKFGLALFAARTAAGLTQEDAGKLLGVDKNTIARWERGKVPPIGGRVRREDLLRRLKEASA